MPSRDLTPIDVDAYAGSRGEEEPRAIRRDGVRVEVAVETFWREPEGRFFRVRCADQRRLVLLCREPDLDWWRVEEGER